MKKNIELQALSEELGPRFQAGAAERDSGDVFVAEHYDLLKERKVFSALIPAEIGGGGAQPQRHVRVSAPACTLLSVDRARAVDA